jgi:NADPH:quinone reductase-like Zn-dependent oxidoreductase
MKTMCLVVTDGKPSLTPRDAATPQPGADEVLVRVHAAGVTPTELGWYPTSHTRTGEPRQNAVPGHEFSGTVAALGSEALGFYAGQEIFGWNDWFSDGATAEYCLARPATIAPKPASLSHVEAASVPIGALTAWQGLIVRAGLSASDRVLIHGGAGAVGIFAIQLARHAGARVITTASARHATFLRDLGAERVIDYRAERFEEHAGEVDVVFDAVGGETLQRSWAVLKPGGRLVTVASGSSEATDARTKAAFFIVEPQQEQLTEIASLFDRGALRTCVDAVVPFAEAASAYFGTAARRNGQGKVVIAVMPEAQSRT